MALEVLQDVGEGAYFNLSLKKHLRGMEEQDKRFVSALCFTTLENIYRIDYVLRQFTGPKRVHRLIQNILRLGVCQLMFFESVPESAAVNESVKLAEKSPKRQLKGFVNGVLRAVARDMGSITYPDREKDPAAFLSVFYSYPLWLTRQYLLDYGEDFTEDLFSYRKSTPDTCIRPNRFKMSPEELENKLEGGSFHYEKGKYVDDAYYVRNLTSIDDWGLYKKGGVTVQGEASMLAVLAANIKPGQRVLDVCAAPGGKTAYAAQFAPETLVAADIHPHRVQLMQDNFARLGVQAETRVANAGEYQREWENTFDRVLIDAPCSALGLLYRKPDIKCHKEQKEVEELVPLQRRILDACAGYVKPGGMLLYSTCTINRRENQENIQWFLKNHKEFSRAHLAALLPAPLMHRAKEDMLQLFPHIDGIDGFFIAALCRREGA